MKRRRLSKKFGIWADPFMRPKTWTPEAAALAVEITKEKRKQAERRLAYLKERQKMLRGVIRARTS